VADFLGCDSIEDLVPKVIDALKTKVSEFNYNNWFRYAQWSLEGEKTIRIQIPNKFVRDWILDNYLEIIKFEFFKLTGKEFEVLFQIIPPSELKQPVFPQIKNQVAPTQAAKKEQLLKLPVGINARYTFDNYVVGNSNQFVFAACQAVANNPAKNYNPLFIYGGVGLGKTHLLNALALEALKKNPSLKIIFVTGEQFTNEVINSIRYDKTYDLRKKYRDNCDILLIDDVQFIAGKERTMEEFFHTFNSLYEDRKQIIVTSDTLPKDILQLEERLRSRFSWGLLADIQIPDFETRCAILRRKAEDDHINMPDDVCQFIAMHVKTNVRDLEGSLIRLSAFASLACIPMTVNVARDVLKNVLGVMAPHLSIEGIQTMVADHYGLKIHDLKSERRHRNLALPRQIAMYLCKKHIKASFPEIGAKFGGKDHTTVIHAVQKIKSAFDQDIGLRSQLEQLENLIQKNS